jgi:hypothetical protein
VLTTAGAVPATCACTVGRAGGTASAACTAPPAAPTSPSAPTPPLFGLRTSEEILVAIARHLAEGVGCRATARLCGTTLNTVLRFTQRFGKHAELFHGSTVRGIHPEQIQADEAWSFVGEKRQEP